MSEYIDTIVRGSGNPLDIIVDGVILSQQSDIEVVFGQETYTLLLNPDVISFATVDGDQHLYLALGDTQEETPSFLDIKVFSALYPRPEGFTLTNKCLGNLEKPKLCG